MCSALSALEAGPALLPYTLSTRARFRRDEVPPDTRFVPVPARILLRSSARADRPRIDRWLRPADVLHATNYLTPPSRIPTLVSVYDCSFVRYPELCSDEVRALEPIVRRAIRPRGNRPHRFGVRGGRDRGDLRARSAPGGPARRHTARRPRAVGDRGPARRDRGARSPARRSSSRSGRSSRGRTSRISWPPSAPWPRGTPTSGS